MLLSEDDERDSKQENQIILVDVNRLIICILDGCAGLGGLGGAAFGEAKMSIGPRLP